MILYLSFQRWLNIFFSLCVFIQITVGFLLAHVGGQATVQVSEHGQDVKSCLQISERNLPNVGMGGWMEALTDKVHKQGEHIPQHCYTFHTTMYPYISSMILCHLACHSVLLM